MCVSPRQQQQQLKEPFTPSIAWAERQWLRYEKLLYRLSQNPRLGLLFAAVVLPCLAIALFLLYPLLFLYTALKTVPPPSGAHGVGQHDFLHTLPSGETVRLRMWYPSDPADEQRETCWWLPGDFAMRVRYARSYPVALNFPSWLALFLGLPLALVRQPSKVQCDVRALAPPSDAQWPVALFSHGLLGSVSAYTALCAEVASHGMVVLTLEHTDGSASHSQLRRGEPGLPYLTNATRPAACASEKAWRAEQTQTRTAQVTALLGTIEEVLQPTPIGALGGGKVETGRAALFGHSFGGATAIETATALRLGSSVAGASVPPIEVSAVVLLDPWMLGCSERVYEAAPSKAAPPVLVVMSQSLMWPEHADDVGRAMRALPRSSNNLLVEAKDSRHQEASDFVPLVYFFMRLSCMAGKVPPLTALRRFLDPTVGFLGSVGATAQRGCPKQATVVKMARRWSGTFPHCDDEDGVILHL